MCYIENSYHRAKNKSIAVSNQMQSTISTAHMAFGGCISRGLLHRGQSAVNKRQGAITKMGRKEVFLMIKNLPKMFTTGYWDKIDEILTKCNIYSDFADRGKPIEYGDASRQWYCKPKLDCLKHFVNKYGNSIERKILLPLLKLK